MKPSERHPGTYTTQDDVNPPRTFTINRLAMEPVEGPDGKKKDKAVLYFMEKGSKPLILNRVNDSRISEAYGKDDEDWHGKKIQLYADPTVIFAGREVGGVRVRPLPTGKVKPRLELPDEEPDDESAPF